MNSNRGFNEVMIVNPYEPGSENNQGAKFMRFHTAPQSMGYYGGYYAQAPDAYGYYAEAPEMYGYYAAPPAGYGYYAAPPAGYGYHAAPPTGYGYHAAPPTGYGYYANLPDAYGQTEPGYAEYEPMGYYGEYEPVGYFAEEYPIGYYAENDPMGYYGEYEPVGYYSEATEMPGYAEYDPATIQPEMAEYGNYSGYVRETPPRFNASCPMPTNVSGLGEANAFQGYVRPSTVNPTCNQFTPQPGQEPPAPDNFKPLW